MCHHRCPCQVRMMKMMLMMTNTILSILLIRESNLLLDQPCWLLVINLVTLDQLHRFVIVIVLLLLIIKSTLAITP